jgi:DeoR/GlpR family transcriptional regulator of sugar metabolism
LPYRQRKAIPALLSSHTLENAAELIGVSTKTIRRYLENPTFKSVLFQAEGEAINAATRRLINLQNKSIDLIASLMDNPATSHNVKLRAAQTVLDFSIKLRELRNLEERIAALENALYVKKYLS